MRQARERGSEGVRDGGRGKGREGGREGGRQGEMCTYHVSADMHVDI